MSIEFSQIEMALKKRMGEIMDKIEEEVTCVAVWLW